MHRKTVWANADFLLLNLAVHTPITGRYRLKVYDIEEPRGVLFSHQVSWTSAHQLKIIDGAFTYSIW
jgi:hypothetical protein